MAARSDIQTTFGARLRELRKRGRLTQQRLGDQAEVNFKFVGAIERGEENPSLLVIGRLADALGVAPAELFETEHLESDAASLRDRAKMMIDSVPSERGVASEDLKRAFRVVRAIVGAERVHGGKRRG